MVRMFMVISPKTDPTACFAASPIRTARPPAKRRRDARHRASVLPVWPYARPEREDDELKSWWRSETAARFQQPVASKARASRACCGYAPAPQARLRHRLKHVWGARVSLINEFRTSKCCCKCGKEMGLVYKSRNKGRTLQRPVKIHGALRCPEHGFCHRDKNAAVNIMTIYEALAAGNPRPSYLVPKGRYA